VLYDSDAAGIKASFRGIDLLLEEGMSVKVALFPEGEDPDSFAKSVSTEELKAYLNDNQKDFVGFKTDILLEGTENDPIQRAGLIKEIVSSIALIPDSITRSVYIKQTAAQFEIEEQTLLNELNKVRRRKQSESRGVPLPKDEVEVDFVKKKAAGETESTRRDFYDQELDLLRILVLYGSRAIELEEPHEEGEEKEELIEVSVAELIIHELQRDELDFHNPLLQKIYLLCAQGLEENIFYEPARFLRHEDPEIVSFVTDILSPRYELSRKWLSDYKIETTEEIHKIPQAVKESLYAFKHAVILRRIEEIQEELKNNQNYEPEVINELLSEQISLEKIKSTFALQLGRIIL